MLQRNESVRGKRSQSKFSNWHGILFYLHLRQIKILKHNNIVFV